MLHPIHLQFFHHLFHRQIHCHPRDDPLCPLILYALCRRRHSYPLSPNDFRGQQPLFHLCCRHPHPPVPLCPHPPLYALLSPPPPPPSPPSPPRPLLRPPPPSL